MILNIEVEATSHEDLMVELQRAIWVKEEATPAIKSCSGSLMKMTAAALESVREGHVKVTIGGHYIGGWMDGKPKNLTLFGASVTAVAV